MDRMVGQVCTVEMGILNGTPCGRRAVMEITERGVHRGWRCVSHATGWKDDNGRVHVSVHNDRNMIPGMMPNNMLSVSVERGEPK
jgi:hypothetical protein